MFEMKDEYLVGIEMIDEEHRKLFEIAEETVHCKIRCDKGNIL